MRVDLAISLTGADGGEADRPSEVVFLPTIECPICSSRSVVVEIEVGQTPVLSCTACGHSSQPPPD
jgi:transcription elongation factor Elf1